MPSPHRSLIARHRRASSVVASVTIASIVSAPAVHAQASGGQRAPDRATLVARIDSIVNASLRTPFASYQVAVVKGNDTLVMKGYGKANLELDVDATASTVYKIGSVTKQFTSAAVMQLVEQGKLSLDDTLGRLMPKAPSHWHRVTVRQLLNHTSGIPSLTDIGPRIRPVMMMGMRRDSILELLRGDSLQFDPGKGFYYNNSGYYLLGMLIESLSGKSYASYVADMIAPLGLSSTTYCSGAAIVTGRASGYDRAGTSFVNASYVDMEVPYAAGSMCSTARDLVKWGRALASGRVVRAESYRLMTTPVALPSAYRMTYGFALMVDTLAGRRVVQHGGNINGFASNLLHLPSESLFVAVNSNSSGAPSGTLSAEIARAVVGVARVAVVQRDEPTSAAERARFVGRYRVGEPSGVRREYTITEADEHIALVPPGGGQTIVLHRQGPHEFSVRGQPAQRVLFDVQGDRVTGIVLDRGVRPLMGGRIP